MDLNTALNTALNLYNLQVRPMVLIATGNQLVTFAHDAAIVHNLTFAELRYNEELNQQYTICSREALQGILTQLAELRIRPAIITLKED